MTLTEFLGEIANCRAHAYTDRDNGWEVNTDEIYLDVEAVRLVIHTLSDGSHVYDIAIKMND